jgi:hypothetical protein
MISPGDSLEPGAVESLFCVLYTEFTCRMQDDTHKQVTKGNGVKHKEDGHA